MMTAEDRYEKKCAELRTTLFSSLCTGLASDPAFWTLTKQERATAYKAAFQDAEDIATRVLRTGLV